MGFSDSPACRSRAHCQTCRIDRAWRESIAASYGGPVDFACPIGLPIGTTPLPQHPTWRLGDWLAALIARLGIRPWTGCRCSQRQAWLNARQTWILGAGAAAALAGAWLR